MLKPSRPGTDLRRALLLLIALGAIGTGIVLSVTAQLEGGEVFAANSAFRIGLVIFALWLALPSLRRPIDWLPPGVAILCLVAIMVIAAHPRLIVIVLPALGVLGALGWAVRLLQRGRRRA